MTSEVADFSSFEQFQCRVWSYQACHSEIVVQLTPVEEITLHENANFSYLLFTHVIYFSGPFSWDGANFTQAPREKCIKALNSLNIEHAEEIAGRFHNLFTKKIEGQEIIIIAAQALHSDSLNPLEPTFT